jgi:hypothetical protein
MAVMDACHSETMLNLEYSKLVDRVHVPWYTYDIDALCC